MATNIDSLSVQIRSNSAGAAKGIDALSASLDKLHKSLAGNGAMSSLAKINQAVKNAGESIGDAPDKLVALARAINELGKAKTSGFSQKTIDNLTNLSNTVRSMPSNAGRKFEDLSIGLSALSTASRITISPTIGREMQNISAAISSTSDADFNRITAMGQALSSLAAVQGINLPRNIAENIFDLGAALEAIQDVDFSRIGTIAEAMAPLASIERAANLGPTLNQLKRLPAIFGELQAMDMNAFAEGVQRLVAALRPLAEAVERIGGGLNNLPERMRDLVTNVNRLNGGGGGGGRGGMGGRGFTQILAGLGIAQLGLRSFASTIKEAISSANKYIEDVNLFTASLGKYATKAKDYADTVSEVMGIDPARWMRNQGVFMTLASGFGVAGDRAYIMSQQLTQLGYDLSSFFNIAVDGEGGAMQKLQAGIAGELEPLRRLGYDLSQAKLQAIALSQGITKAYNSMTQAEKVQLRYYAIMTQVTTAQGDMARTLNAPANQMRIFSAQLQMAARAIGNIFIPALNAILPYAIAFVKAIRFMAEAVASFFGYSLPEIDYSGLQEVAGGFDDIGKAAGGAAGKAAKLKSYLMGFDELNVIDPTQGGGGGGGSGSGGGGSGSGWDWELPTYDFLGDAVESRVDAVMAKLKPAIEWVRDNIKLVLTAIGGIATGMMAWKVASGFTDGINGIWDALKGIMGIGLWLATVGISAVVTYKLDEDYLKTGGIGKILGESVLALIAAFAGYKVALPMFGVKGAYGLAGLTLEISALVTLAALFKNADLSEFDMQEAVVALVGMLKAGIGAMIAWKGFGHSMGQSAMFGAGIALAVGTAIGLKAMYDSTLDEDGFNWDSAGWGLVSLLLSAASGATIAKALGLSIGKGTAVGGAIGIALVTGIGLKYVYDKTKDSTEFSWLNAGAGLGSALTSFASGAMMAKAVGLSAIKGGMAGVAISLMVDTAFGLKYIYNSAQDEKEGISWNTIRNSLVTMLTGTGAGALLAKALGLSIAAGAGAGALITLGLIVGTYIIAKSASDKNVIEAAVWGTTSLMAGEIRTFAEKLFGDIDVEAVIDVANAKITGVEEAKSQLDGELEEYGSKIRLLELGIGVDKLSLQDTYNYIFGEGGMKETWQSVLKKEDNFMEYGVSLIPQEVNFDSATFLQNWNNSTAILEEAMDKAGQHIVEIFNNAQGRELDSDEQRMVQEYLDYIYKIQEAVAKGTVTGDYQYGTDAILRGVDLTSLDRTSFVQVATEWGTLSQELFTSLNAVNEQMKKTLSERIETLKGIVESDLTDEETKKKAQAAMDALIKQYDELIEAGVVNAEWDKYTAEARGQFLDAIKHNFAKPFDAFNPEEFWGEGTIWNIQQWLGGDEEMAESVDQFFMDLQDAITSHMTKEDKIAYLSVKDSIGFKDWDILGEDVKQNIIDQLINLGFSSDDIRRLFEKAGYELGGLYTSNLFRGITEEEEHARPKLSASSEETGKEIAKGVAKGTDKQTTADKSKYNSYWRRVRESAKETLVTGNKLLAIMKLAAKDIDTGLDTQTAADKPKYSGYFGRVLTTAEETLVDGNPGKTVGESVASDVVSGLNETIDNADITDIHINTILENGNWVTVEEWIANYSTGHYTETLLLASGFGDTVKDWLTTKDGIDFYKTVLLDLPEGDVTTWLQAGKQYGPDFLKKVFLDKGFGEDVSAWLTTKDGGDFFKKVLLNLPVDNVTAWLEMAKQYGPEFAKKVYLEKGWTGTVEEKLNIPSTTSIVANLAKKWTKPATEELGIPSSTSLTAYLTRSYANGTPSSWGFNSWLTGNADGKAKVTVNLQKGTGLTFSGQYQSSIKFAANGGYVSTGEMFIAREAGPELVGSIGNRTAVANNDQIVQGIEGGVRTANEDVVAAIYTLIGAVENKDMSVNIGDDAIGRANARYTRKRGVVVNPGAFANSY